MALPSRTAFLATGLTPLSTTTIPAPCNSPASPTECSVCVSTPTSPIRLPCSHTFCKNCITSWLSAPGKNSCAVCRTPLFALPAGETDDRGTVSAGQDLRAAAAQALRTSGLTTLMVGRGAGESPGAFGAQTTTTSHLQRATAAGVRFLAAGEREVGAERVQVEKDFLAAYVIAIGFFLPAFAAALGRANDTPVRQAWDALVGKVWVAVEGLDGEVMEATGLERKLSEVVAGAGGEEFAEGSGREREATELVKFIVLQAQERLRQRESVKTYRKHHRGIWGKEKRACRIM